MLIRKIERMHVGSHQKALLSSTMNTVAEDIANLVSELKNGSEKAFSELYDRYSAALNGVIMRFIPDPDAAADILQDTFIKIWKNIGSFDDTKGTIFTWMLNIARNNSIDAIRKSKKGGVKEIRSIDDHVHAAGVEAQSVNTIGLVQLLEKLPSEQRIMIEYQYFNGFTQQETADELGLPLGTVKTRTRIALRELRKFFSLLLLWI